MKKIYGLQPYEVGTRNSKSLALVIPARVVKECNINTSTIFALRTNPSTKRATVQQTEYPIEEKKSDETFITARDSLKARYRQQTTEIV